jgi:hypothetical protein
MSRLRNEESRPVSGFPKQHTDSLSVAPEQAGERTETRRLSDDGRRLIIVTRWLDRQVSPPRWRSKNRHVKLTPGEVEYYRERRP